MKGLLISILDKVIYYKGTFLQGSMKPLFTTQSRLETSRKKIRPFFQHASSRYVGSTKISMTGAVSLFSNVALIFFTFFSGSNLSNLDGLRDLSINLDGLRDLSICVPM
jgi:hypothetical protein